MQRDRYAGGEMLRRMIAAMVTLILQHRKFPRCALRAALRDETSPVIG